MFALIFPDRGPQQGDDRIQDNYDYDHLQIERSSNTGEYPVSEIDLEDKRQKNSAKAVVFINLLIEDFAAGKSLFGQRMINGSRCQSEITDKLENSHKRNPFSRYWV